MKKCIRCKQLKEFSHFYKNKSSIDGFQTYCSLCMKELAKTKYSVSTERARKSYYRKNKDKLIKVINKNNRDRDFGLSYVFNSMRRRCKYSSQESYKYYGGKGIIVEWEKYVDFKNDMYESFLEHISIYGKRQTTIDRIDSDKNYCKENCRWATYKQQAESKKLKLSTV